MIGARLPMGGRWVDSDAWRSLSEPLLAFGHPPLPGEGIGNQRGVVGRGVSGPPLLGGEGLG